MNKTIGVLIVMVLALIIASLSYITFTGFNVLDNEKKVIKIGAVLPLTGTSADAGDYIRKGLLLAQEEINKNSKNNYVLIFEDSLYSPQTAVTAFNKLENIDKIDFLVPYGSSISMALAPLAEQNKIILLDPASQSDKITDAGSYIFRTQSNVIQEAEFFSGFIKKKAGNNKLGIIAINTEYGESVIIDYSLPKFGLNIGPVQKFESKESDFKSYILKLKSEKIKYVLLAANAKQTGLIVKQAYEMDYHPVFFSTSAGIERKDYLDISGKLGEGIVYPYPYNGQSNDNSQKEFREKYFKKYGENNEMLAANAYDVLKLIALCTESEKEAKSCLYDIKNYNGASGTITFDSKGDVIKPFVLKTVKDGKFVNYKV